MRYRLVSHADVQGAPGPGFPANDPFAETWISDHIACCAATAMSRPRATPSPPTFVNDAISTTHLEAA